MSRREEILAEMGITPVWRLKNRPEAQAQRTERQQTNLRAALDGGRLALGDGQIDLLLIPNLGAC